MATQRNARRWARSIRLIFEDVGGELRLVARQRVNMVPPPSPVIEQGQSGVWAELRTAQEEPVYQQILAHQMAPGVEVFSPDPKRSIRRVASSKPKTIVIVVPDTEEARALVIMGPAAEKGRRLTSAEAFRTRSSEIARFDLSDDREKGGRS